MTVIRRRLFWKVYLTLLASLVVAAIALGTFFWFLGETQREGPRGEAAAWPSEMTQYASDGRMVGARGRPISVRDYEDEHHYGPGHVARVELPAGGYVLTRFGPPPGARAIRLLAAVLAVVGGVGLAAYPVTAVITRRLEGLRVGVAQWGADRAPPQLDERGSDEVALLARAFNQAAGRLDAMLASQKALLANASHELRSPLARLRVAVELGTADGGRGRQGEIVQNLAEMDQLVDELLLSSRLDHLDGLGDRRETIDLLGLAAEEAVRYDAMVSGEPVEIIGDATLIRRLIRNLLENGARHGRPPINMTVLRQMPGRQPGGCVIAVDDAGPGVLPDDRERIFEPFYRPSGSSERTGGWGLGLALVRQIAERHGGSAECVAAAGGSRFVVHLATGA